MRLVTYNVFYKRARKNIMNPNDRLLYNLLERYFNVSFMS